jgi:type I restriction enzyme S subunit
MTNVTQEDIRAVPLYLPTLPEQRRIADILDKADAIRHKRKEAIALTDDLLHSAFLDMFGDPVTNPKGWNVKPLEDLVDQHRGISYGVVQRGPEVVDGVPVVRISNFGDNRFDGSNVVRTSSEISNSFRRTILRGGELVVSIRGTVGRVAVVPRLAFGWNVSREVAVVPLLDGVSRALVHRALLSDGVQRFILGNVKGVAQSGINLSDLRQAPIPCPPPREVDRFERVALTTAEMERSIVSASERSEDLFNTLVQEAFSIPTPRELER